MKVSGVRLAWILLGSLIAAGYQPVFCNAVRSIFSKDDTLSSSLDELDVAEDLDSAEVNVHPRDETPTFLITSEDQQYGKRQQHGDQTDSYFSDDINDNDFKRFVLNKIKRQQGWHTKYGKRLETLKHAVKDFQHGGISFPTKRSMHWTT